MRYAVHVTPLLRGDDVEPPARYALQVNPSGACRALKDGLAGHVRVIDSFHIISYAPPKETANKIFFSGREKSRKEKVRCIDLVGIG